VADIEPPLAEATIQVEMPVSVSPRAGSIPLRYALALGLLPQVVTGIVKTS